MAVSFINLSNSHKMRLFEWRITSRIKYNIRNSLTGGHFTFNAGFISRKNNEPSFPYLKDHASYASFSYDMISRLSSA